MKTFEEMDKPRVQKMPGFNGERPIEGVVIKDLVTFSDERGFLIELMRLDDHGMKAADIKQIIASYSYPGMVKGWHIHSRQQDRLICVHGMVKLALYDYRRDSPTYGIVNEIFMGERYPRAVYIPPGIFHGTKNIGTDIAVVIGMPSLLYDPENVDERRLDPNDNDLIPYEWGCKME